MLVQFSLTNFRNFKDTATIDLTEAKITEMKSHLYRCSDGIGILPMAAIYGPNGSGKTNFLEGLWTLRNLVIDSPKVSLKNDPFLFDEESRMTPVEFDVLFRIKEREYEYQLKMMDGTVVEENLFGRDLSEDEFSVLFDHDSEGVFLCESWEDTDVSELKEDTPLLYFLGKNQKEKELQSIISYFQSMCYVSEENMDKQFLREVLQSNTLKLTLLEHLNTMEFPITDIQASDDSYVIIYKKNGIKVPFVWEKESLGIRRLICLLSLIIIARQKGMLLLIDAPEVQFNPKVVGYLYCFIADTGLSPAFAQVLMATHENSTMNNKIFRRDELWLTGFLEDGSSTLYTLALFLKENGEKVRKDETYFKQYLEGRYGACPMI